MGEPGPLRVLHLTDSHLFGTDDGELRGTRTAQSLQSVLSHYRAGGWQAEIALATGDLVQDDSTAAYRRFRQLLGSTGLPVHCVPGNHDVLAPMRDVLGSPPFYYCDAVRAGSWLIVGLDSTEAGQVGGRISQAELERLDAGIAASDAAHVAICLHHPPVAVGSRWLDTVGLANGAELLQRAAASGRVRLVLFGHVHQAFDGSVGDLRIIGTPSTCRQFTVGSDEYAVDDNPPAYRRIALYTDGRIDSELVWVKQ